MGRGEKILLVPFSFELHACGVGVGVSIFLLPEQGTG
jgi:hypothetical protein